MNIKIILCRGIQASGKSTWSRDYAKSNPGWVRISRDDIREIVIPYKQYSPKYEEFVTAIQRKMIFASLEYGNNVVIDDTNINDSYINSFLKFFRECSTNLKISLDVSTKWFDIDPKIAIERDAKRDRTVGEKVIMEFYNRIKSKYPLVNDSWSIEAKSPSDSIIDIERERMTNIPKYIAGAPDAIIVDIDGTVARMHDRSPYDWSKVGNDHVNHDVVDIVKTYSNMGTQVIIVTGRDGVAGKATQEWLRKNDIPADYFFIRRENDNRNDAIVKKEIYDNHIKGNFNIKFVLDDRDRVVSMWRNEGLRCLQVAPGDF